MTIILLDSRFRGNDIENSSYATTSVKPWYDNNILPLNSIFKNTHDYYK
ncbi:hypothetical protein [Rickettsia endosymbiont of Orchestes rusci]